MSRKLEDLIPILAIKASELSKVIKDTGLEWVITSTWRPFHEQQALYDQGRTAPGRIVTNAKAGESFHNYGCAFDFAVLHDEKIDWNDLPTYRRVGELGEELGLQWGGRFKGLIDLPHFQMSFGFSTSELLKIYQSGGISGVWKECNKKYEQGLWP